jgi:hypothetical protein
MSSPEGKDHIVSGVYREITRPERLVLTWAWEEEGVRGHETLVTIELAETPGGTRLELTQEGFESERDGGLVGLADLVQDVADLVRPTALHGNVGKGRCFTVSENPFFESGTDGKFDATFTNWCTEQEPVTVILACSSTPQPGNPSRGE